MQAGTGRQRDKEKSKILDDYLELIRKHTVWALNREGKKPLRFVNGKNVNVIITGNRHKKRGYKKYYDDEAAGVLIKLWKFFRYICGERLILLLRANIDAISRKRRFKMSAEVKKKLAAISRATVERLLTRERKKHKLKGKSTAKKVALLKNQIAVRIFWAWVYLKISILYKGTRTLETLLWQKVSPSA
ncbi:MAG: hypothetical protein LBH43_20835 [Treponema sp.]|jgi:hypothetical protein|nr:hypothetical protein [Treponema sp.]